MKHLLHQLKHAIDALADENGGERNGRRAMAERLFHTNPGTTSTPVALDSASPRQKGPRWIALGVGESLPKDVVDYAAGACQRMGASLLLVTAIGHDNLMALLQPYQETISGLNCETEHLAVDTRRQAINVLKSRFGVQFAISGTSDDPLRSLACHKGGFLDPKVPIPIVVIGDKESHQCRGMARIDSRTAEAGLRRIH